jgi:hypothetical protein
MEAELLVTTISALAQPGGLIVLVALVLYGAYNIMVKHVLPMQEKHISSLLQDAADDRELFKSAFAAVGLKLEKVTDRLEHLEDKVTVLFQSK